MLSILKKYYTEIYNNFYRKNSVLIPTSAKHDAYNILKKECVKFTEEHKGAKWLDLGCGRCINTEDLLTIKKIDLHGVDLAEEGFKGAKKIKKGNLRKASVDELTGKEAGYGENEFDFVSSVFAFSAIAPDIRLSTIAEVYKVLKQGGKFVLLELLNPAPALTQMPVQQVSAQLMIEKEQVMLPMFALSAEIYEEYLKKNFKILKKTEVNIKLGDQDSRCILMVFEKV